MINRSNRIPTIEGDVADHDGLSFSRLFSLDFGIEMLIKSSLNALNPIGGAV